MLSDRQYMREAEGRAPVDPVRWLMIAFVGLYLLQLVLERWLDLTAYYGWFRLSGGAVLHGLRPWTLLTYAFLVDTAGYTGGVFVLIFNLLGLYFFGGAVRDLIGARRFLWLYGGFVLLGALAWCAAYPLRVDWALLGPLAALSGVFALYCCYHADEPVTFLAFFIIPVTMKPKFFGWLWAVVNLIGFLFYEMMGHPSPLWEGHAAILANMAAAYGYFRVAGRVSPFGGSFASGLTLPGWLRRRKKPAAGAAHFKVNISSRDDLRAEVDRILDKINSDGFGALTEEEKRLLDDARELLSRR
ncbi:MAG TPA: rhomboid family intramembrane serine protease [Opitutaceae bacterium]|nr:rhomboid family intramembrane serine protease [Opitutaceae bacterium]